ncbi:hypothetical protein BJ878DRAFT_166928 [Calycina marina]|uniref:Uncharacterized protein n=1 Tax=Calycina marina TaxID=1763456 RepID=A0A9P8CCZ8_9HELO|nr:hypothetical protein BJ878DRAFT_166928 [Calycina marina]
MQTSAPSWEKLSNKECVKTYSNMFLSSRRNVILVSSAKNDTNSVLLYGSTDIVSGILGGGGAGDANWWICSSGGQDGGNMMCNPNGHVTSSGAFSLWEYPIEYCLSEKVEDTCSLNFSQDIMYVMLAFNALKVAMMILVLFQYDAEIILASVGDAIASFMTYEDQSTRMMCLANRREMKRFWRSRGMARTFSQQRRRWGVAVSKKRWAFFLFFTLFSLCIVAFFGLWGFVHLKNRGIGLDPSSLWQIGFGQANQNTLVLYDNMRDRDAITMAIIANIPQILLAIGYLLYLGIMTTMFLASDFSNFAFKPQNLMVSTARGKQRGTWMFGAPMGWGITFVIFGTLFHWLVSQSIFVVKFQVYFKDGTAATPTEDSLDYSHLTNAGYSPIAIIFSIIAAGLMLLSSFIFMFRRFPGGAPPVVSTCTAAISAACHPSNRYPGIVFGKFRWGANGGFENGVGHCSLVPAQAWDLRQAGPSTEGWSYAGFPESQSL